MIYLESFNIFSIDDETIITNRIIECINQYFKEDNTFIEVTSISSTSNIKFNLIDYFKLTYSKYTYRMTINDKLVLISNPQYTSLVRGMIVTKYLYTKEIYEKIEDLFILQNKKWIVYKYISDLIKSFTMYNPTNTKVGSRIMNIVGMGYDPKQIWEKFNNELNEDFSFFRYPNIVNMDRLKDMLISDYEFDLNKRGESELKRTVMLLERNGIKIV